MNFEKPLPDFSEEELQQRINQVDPRFGVLLSYELLRRLAIKNEESSERFSEASFYLAIVAILVSLGIGAVQIYLSILS
jgi:hypothetical protein